MATKIQSNFLKIGMAIFLVITSFCIYGFWKGPKADMPTIVVNTADYGSVPNSMSGFLHIYPSGKLQEVITELKPKYWRIGGNWIEGLNRKDQFVKTLNANNIRPILILSSTYRYASSNLKGWVNPVQNSQPFLFNVEALYKEYGNTVIYDVWNEPNHKSYWRESNASFFQLFKQVHDKIRSLPGGKSALITGPSATGYKPDYLIAFLDFCQQNNLKVDYLNWHDMRLVSNPSYYSTLKKNVDYIKSLIKSKYSSIGIKSIILPEVIGIKEQYAPLQSFIAFRSFESLGVDGACKACWNNTSGVNNCFNGSLDGLYTKDKRPRAIWWAYKLYAQSMDRRFAATAGSSTTVDAYANKGLDTLNVLFGNLNFKSSDNIQLEMKYISSLSQFKNLKQVKAVLYEIPNSNEYALDSPILVSSSMVKLNSGEALINVNNLKNSSLYLMQFSK